MKKIDTSRKHRDTDPGLFGDRFIHWLDVSGRSCYEHRHRSGIVVTITERDTGIGFDMFITGTGDRLLGHFTGGVTGLLGEIIDSWDTWSRLNGYSEQTYKRSRHYRDTSTRDTDPAGDSIRNR